MTDRTKLTPENWTPAPLDGPPLDVLHLDEHLVAVVKPADMNVHREQRAGARGRHALQTVSRQIGKYVFPVHRLDRNTSGILLFALSSDAATGLQASMAEASKVYLALVRGETPETFVCERPLTGESGEKQAARSSFRRLATFSRCSLIEVTIDTGRKHQIRRHCSGLAHQVIGDSSYGKGRINRFFRYEYGLPRMFLHATRLAVRHPMTGADLSWHVPLPDDLRGFLERLPDVPPDQLATW